MAALLVQLLALDSMLGDEYLANGVMEALIRLCEAYPQARSAVLDAGALPILALLAGEGPQSIERRARQLSVLVVEPLPDIEPSDTGSGHEWAGLLATAHVMRFVFRHVPLHEIWSAQNWSPESMAEVDAPHTIPAFVDEQASPPTAANRWLRLPAGFVVHLPSFLLAAAGNFGSNASTDSASDSGLSAGDETSAAPPLGSSEALDDAINRSARASVYALELTLDDAGDGGLLNPRGARLCGASKRFSVANLEAMLSQVEEAASAVTASRSDAANLGTIGDSGLFGSYLRHVIDDSLHPSELEALVEQLTACQLAPGAGTGFFNPSSLTSSSLGLVHMRHGERPFALSSSTPGRQLDLRLLIPFRAARHKPLSLVAPAESDELLSELSESSGSPRRSSGASSRRSSAGARACAVPEAAPRWLRVGSAPAVILARIVHANPSLVLNRTVLELGSGCGLVSLVAAHCQPAALVATTLPGAPAEWLDVNLYLSRPTDEVVASLPLAWDSSSWATEAAAWSSPSSVAAFDLVLAADPVYDAQTGAGTAAVLASLLTPGGLALVVHPHPSTRYGLEVFHAALARTSQLTHIVAEVPAWLKAAVECEDDPYFATWVWRSLDP
ncbi:uncharacterized protein AMSG_00287 [Thecamonas trahens ATCC 50062]|uniref:Uncharacterized protein n=1 Tax=Thecamonas trahens ATCC 50062 TaxID=461836 RepID=A0A0L0D4E2_THETB|nr:hypothetical protein AMSG_00287 [Thecamonas trahens ATCC 50062]KNC46168.1 hypothetical protein AMSG_00287 [Thecamonas trahens ATCC 50062]|eukprot:XP_013763143.1 hypothetical protein AMSG_00287 [Thecamonas trahens ATCC 50062]